MQIDVGYPELDAERQVLIATTGIDEAEPTQVLSGRDLLKAQQTIRRVPVSESVVEAILDLVRNGRPEMTKHEAVEKHVAWAPGPRAGQALMLATRARAVLDGRLAPSVDDVLALAKPVLRHRMALNFAARADGVTIEQVIDQITEPLR